MARNNRSDLRDKRGNGEGNIHYDEKNDRWVGSINYNGKRKYFTSGKCGKRSDVVKKMDEWRKSVNKEALMTRKIHLDERLKDWLVTIKQPALKPSSYDRLEQTVNLQLIPRLGDCELKDITDQLIKTQLIDKMLEENYSISTTKKAYDAMHDFLNYAIYRRLLTFHPMAMMKPPKPVGYDDADPDDEEGEMDQGGITVLNAEERQAVRDMAAFRWKSGHKDLRYPMGWAFVLIMNTGLRMGEALALKWTDVDLEAKELRVTKNAVVIKNRAKEGPKQKLVVQNTPKSKKSRRVIPLNQEAVNALTQLKARPGTKEDGYIIHTADGSPMLPRNFEASLTLLCKASNIRPIGVHALRHTFATRLYEKGVDVKVISELLGHSSVDITYRIYIHVFEQSKRSAIQVLDLD